MQRLDLVNLYINHTHYNPEYNFYNYLKFRQTYIIPIIYKTPSIFLNGLHFEFPYIQIMNISKPCDSTHFNLLVKITKQNFVSPSVSFNMLFDTLTKLETYNQSFFTKNANKMEIRAKKTLKNGSKTNSLQNLPTQRSPSETLMPSNLLANSEGWVANNRVSTVSEDMSSSDDDNIRFKNPLTKQFEYIPCFQMQDDDNIYLELEIKHIYLSQIIKLIQSNVRQDTLQPENKQKSFTNFTKLYEFINNDIYEFKRNSYDLKITDDMLPLHIRVWVKSNLFIIDNDKHIKMKWKICDYAI